MQDSLTVLESLDILDDFKPITVKAQYVGGKIWKQHFDDGNPIKIIGYYKKSFQKIDDLSNKLRWHHVLKGPDHDIVINGYDHLDIQMQSVDVGNCIMVEFVGCGKPSNPLWKPPMRFLVSINVKRSLKGDELENLKKEIILEEQEFLKSKEMQGA